MSRSAIASPSTVPGVATVTVVADSSPFAIRTRAPYGIVSPPLLALTAVTATPADVTLVALRLAIQPALSVQIPHGLEDHFLGLSLRGDRAVENKRVPRAAATADRNPHRADCLHRLDRSTVTTRPGLPSSLRQQILSSSETADCFDPCRSDNELAVRQVRQDVVRRASTRPDNRTTGRIRRNLSRAPGPEIVVLERNANSPVDSI